VRSRGPWEFLWKLGRRAYDALGSFLDRRAIAAARVIVTNSHFSAEQLAAGYGISPKVIELGVDVTRFHPKSEQERAPVALLVGGLDPTKGAELAIESVARVPSQYRPALRLIWNRGDANYGDHLRTRASSLGVELQLLQDISDDQLIAEYQGASLLLALASNEPFGLTVLEASASGTPTVAVAEGGFRRTVRSEINGLLVPRDPNAIASAVSQIIRGDVQFHEEAMAAWTQEHWSWERCARDLRQELLLISRAPS
jgi:D-inositol-3-phosphate glycosyltransferase